MEFKKDFIEKYSKLTDFNKYKESVLKEPRRALRVNTLKINVKGCLNLLQSKGWQLEQVPWCKEGFFLNSIEIGIGNSEEHKKGYFFVQSAASMLPPVILNPKENDVVLDMSASPGGKTTHLAALMNNKGLIVANDVGNERLKILKINLQRCSVLNCIITNMSGDKVSGIEFDKILLDTPCSGSGLIKGNNLETKKTLKVWNENQIKRLAKLQKKLISNAFDLLKENGELVYSTCSLEPEEDENIIDFLLENRNAKIINYDINIKSSHTKFIKLWPQYYGTEGFFIAKIKKI